MTRAEVSSADLAAAVMAGSMGLDAAAEVWRHAHPMPYGWPFRAGDDPADYFPLVGKREVGGAWECRRPEPEPEPEPVATPRRGRPPVVKWPDILANTYPGDSITDVARRLEVSRALIAMRRQFRPDLAEQMDIRRGA